MPAYAKFRFASLFEQLVSVHDEVVFFFFCFFRVEKFRSESENTMVRKTTVDFRNFYGVDKYFSRTIVTNRRQTFRIAVNMLRFVYTDNILRNNFFEGNAVFSRADEAISAFIFYYFDSTVITGLRISAILRF